MSDAGASSRWGWVLPVVLLVAASVLYAQIGLVHAIPRVIPGLLERSLATESELTRTFRASISAVSVVSPPLLLFSLTTLVWGLVRLAGARPGFSGIFTIVARASLFVTASLLVKTILVLTTKTPDPPVNLGFWIEGRTPVLSALLAFTNPFALAAIVATVGGLRAIGLSAERAAWAGGLPWALGLVLLAQTSGSGGVVPPVRSVTQGWAAVEGAATIVRHPPQLREAIPFARALDSFAARLDAKLDASSGEASAGTAPPDRGAPLLHVDVFPDHAALERATGEALPVEVTGSIRGRDLVYLEMPGRSPAVPEPRALEDAARYVALMILAPRTGDAPRWFVEGLAHAETVPYSVDVDRSYVAALRRVGVPSLALLEDPRFYRTPEGPLLARGFVDFIALRHGGRDAIDGIVRGLLAGAPFRDVLFERTRRTVSALEAEWTEAVRPVASPADSTSAASRRAAGAPANEASVP